MGSPWLRIRLLPDVLPRLRPHLRRTLSVHAASPRLNLSSPPPLLPPVGAQIRVVRVHHRNSGGGGDGKQGRLSEPKAWTGAGGLALLLLGSRDHRRRPRHTSGPVLLVQRIEACGSEGPHRRPPPHAGARRRRQVQGRHEWPLGVCGEAGVVGCEEFDCGELKWDVGPLCIDHLRYLVALPPIIHKGYLSFLLVDGDIQISWSLLLDRLWHGLFVVHHGWFPMLEMRLKNASYTAGFQLEFQSMLNSGSRGMGTVSSKIYLMWTTLRIHWRRCPHTERVASKAGRKSETRFLCSMLHISWFTLKTSFFMTANGDPDINRAKFNQDGSGDIVIEPHLLEDKAMCADQEYSSSHIDIEASTSNADPPAITQETSADCLPKEMSDMTIRDDKIDYYNDKEMEGTVVHGHGMERGQVIVTTIGGQNEKSKQTSC